MTQDRSAGAGGPDKTNTRPWVRPSEGGYVKKLLIAAVAAWACAVAPAMAQDAPIYVWINFMKAKGGNTDALAGMVIEDDARLLDPLVDSGAAVDWGVAMPVVHDGGDNGTVIEWISFRGWAGADAFMKAFMAQREAMGAEGNKAMMERWAKVFEAGSHADVINRSIHMGAGKPARPGYFHIGYFQARPGKWQAATDMYKERAAPVFDQLVADGTVINYGLHSPEVHRGEKWTHMTWYASADLATRDKVDAAFDAARAARSKQDNEAFDQRWRETLDPEGHSDQILLVVHYKSAGGQ